MIFIAIAIAVGLISVGQSIGKLADAIRYATTMRSIEIEGEPHRSIDSAYKINVRIK